MIDRSVLRRSPAAIAVGYAAVGSLWILGSDVLVYAVVENLGLAVSVEMIKGWLFVAGSLVVLYGLVSYSQRDLERTNERLDRALQQTSILQRIIWHNLRNTCNIIRGNAELLADDEATGDQTDRVETITDQTERLVELSEKTHLLRDVVLDDSHVSQQLDLSKLLELRVEAVRRRYPSATGRTDSPDGIVHETDPRLETAIDELLENAIEHDDTAAPVVEVAIETDPDGPVVIELSDTGPGLPDIERTVFEEGIETPLSHSEGVGLWIAQMIVTQLEGSITIEDNEPRGTTVRMSIP
ncbi:HAMP domain-containing sensor histidine kinase [Natrinema sp. 1APR25-10V2]|uniref:sensor histidine kinase n=1 Tax=Natrinema sp. 1APR25-10V2 TaxID=2951081 RepID=UPI002874A223|nr:HAMP domain-containing sensor histidine kinase [Natrinema sp. 1APR25-10V2]MDS0474724.1 HAMP domain-containing histidine kinase [Natrinema sp. 1APR25-10V2]